MSQLEESPRRERLPVKILLRQGQWIYATSVLNVRTRSVSVTTTIAIHHPDALGGAARP